MRALLLVALLLPNGFSAHARAPSIDTIAEAEAYFSEAHFPQLGSFLQSLSPLTRASFVLMRESASLQPTNDPLKPRVILFGARGKLIMAFNEGGQSLELIEQKGDRFEFLRLNLRAGKPPTKQTNCVGCHQGHPLWGQYRNWAGMYGGDQEMVPSKSAEERDYRSFVELAGTHGLYGKLIFKCGTYYNGGIVPGFVPRGGPADCKEISELVTGEEHPERLDRRLSQPGEGLGELLNRLNVERLRVKARASEGYEKLKHVFAANMLGCLGERVYDYSTEKESLRRVRDALKDRARPIAAEIERRAKFAGSREGTMQGQLLNLLSIRLESDLRLDLRANGANLGNDCDKNAGYSPNPYCQPGQYGYDAYSDGTDMGADLLGYAALKGIYLEDPQARDVLLSSLNTTLDYFLGKPDGGEGYDNVGYAIRALSDVREDLKNENSDPAYVPTYQQAYAFAKLLRWGNGEAVCRFLVDKIEL